MSICGKCGSERKRYGKDRKLRCPTCKLNYDRKRRQENPEIQREYSRKHHSIIRASGLTNDKIVKIKKRYGLTEQQYLSLMQLEQHSCAICGKPLLLVSKNTHIDHCHITGVVRGILCHKCNKGMGFLSDDPELLRKAAEYLEEREGGMTLPLQGYPGNSVS